MYKKIVNKESKELIETVLKETSIFKIDEFPLAAAAHDVGTGWENSENYLRSRWLFDKFGFIEDLTSYNSFLRRLNEFFYYGDYLHTLRQRLNIIHLMMDCNFDTNTPVHVSIAPHDRNLKHKLKLDLHDKSSLGPFSIIAHPGQTRFQASVFAKDKLKNVLIYINKKFLKDIDIQTRGLKEIKTVEELLESHTPIPPLNEEVLADLSHYEYDFIMPNSGAELPAKYHVYNECYVLKAANVMAKTLSPQEDKKHVMWQSHPSLSYMTKSFVYSDRYFRLLFNNKFNVYTDRDTEELGTKYRLLYHKILGESHNKVDYSEFAYVKGLIHFKELDHNNYDIDHIWNVEEIKRLGRHTFTEIEQETVDKFHSIARRNKPAKTQLKFDLIKSPLADPLYYVKQNEYKGICIVVNTDKCKRLFEELLFFCNPFSPIAKNKEGTVLVINCEHEYWKEKKDYSEYILTDDFING